MVVALPCFHLVARAFPQAERVLLTGPPDGEAASAVGIVGKSRLIRASLQFTPGVRGVGETLRLAWRIRRFKADVLVYLMPLRPSNQVARDLRLFRLAGISRILGLPDNQVLKHAYDVPAGRFESESSRLARSLRELGDAAVDEPANWSLALTVEEKGAAAIGLGPLMRKRLIACSPGTRMQAKDWGRDRWRKLLARLHSRYPDHGLAFVGDAEDEDLCDYIGWDWTGPRVNLCGKLTPRESAAAVEHARIFLGADSSFMHLASCVGVPCVIAFSARGLPGIGYPCGHDHQILYHRTTCYGCNLESCIAEARRCLTAIPIAAMEAAAARVLDR
ncbi:MAG TPA: glycosyltransferase family 9 protein [Terracidiphilus sp.]|nr:glycosyltransferase family 9 protein [Terracidiphilus sp.]